MTFHVSAVQLSDGGVYYGLDVYGGEHYRTEDGGESWTRTPGTVAEHRGRNDLASAHAGGAGPSPVDACAACGAWIRKTTFSICAEASNACSPKPMVSTLRHALARKGARIDDDTPHTRDYSVRRPRSARMSSMPIHATEPVNTAGTTFIPSQSGIPTRRVVRPSSALTASSAATILE